MKDVPHRVLQTETFAARHGSLRDTRAKVAIARRIERIEAGTLGDVKSLVSLPVVVKRSRAW